MAEPRSIDLDDLDLVACEACGGTGEGEHDCMDDTCCCLDPEPGTCDVCGGAGAWLAEPKEDRDGQATARP